MQAIDKQLTMILSDDKITIQGPEYNILKECSFDNAVFISMGLGRLFKRSLLKKLMRSSGSINVDSTDNATVILESNQLSINPDELESGMDYLGMIFVKKDGDILYEGTLNDSAKIFTILCDMFGATTIHNLLDNPEEVNLIRVNEKYLF